RCHQHKIIAWREIPRLSNQARIHAAPSPRTSNRRSPLRTPNWSNSADTCNNRPSAVAFANAYRNPATSTTAVNVHTSLRPVDGWALVLTSSGSRMALRLPNLPHVGQGALRGAHFKGMVRTWG